MSVKTRFVVPLLALVLAFACAPAAFADTYTAGEIGDDGTAPFGPGAAFENAEITIDSGQTFIYTGKAIKPSISVWLLNEETGNKEMLTKGTDYEVFYKNNVDAGKAIVCAWCQDEEHMYTVKKKFTITKALLKPANKAMKVKIAKKEYTGKKLTPAPKITYKGMTLVKGTDYTVNYFKNKNAGTAKAVIKGKGNYKGTYPKTFKITKAKLANVKTSNVSAKVYTGSKIQPKVTLKYKGQKLKAKKDYTVKYKNNLNVGTASITFKGKGNFKGSRTLQFAINQASIRNCSVSYQKSWHWNGSLIKPALNVTYKGKKLAEGKDYLVGYSNNSEVGTAHITIQGTGNFTGSDKFDFTITLLPLTDSSISTTPANGTLYNYTGNSILPQVTVKITANGKSYIVNPDYYDVFYSEVRAGNYYTYSQALANNLCKGNAKKDKIYHIRIQAKEGTKYFTGYRTVNYTVLKPAN